nr:flagellar hook-associated protein FlgK [Paracoccus aestuariivivens]
MSAAISNSLSGLTATARGTEIVSTNVSNKSVAGYARRELDLSSRLYSGNGGGVQIDGVRRTVNAGLLADSRIAQASTSRSTTVANFHAAMETSFGTANDNSSLVSFVTAFEAAIVSASARPDSDVRLQEVLDSATGLTEKITGIAKSISDARSSADRSIAKDVDQLNTALERVAALNRQITTLSSQGQDTSSLVDARQTTLDSISSIVPIVEVARENGRIAIFTKGGGTLLDGTSPARLEFTPAGQITPEMNVEHGSLGTITINGRPLSKNEMGILAGGSMAANFELRDTLAPAYQQKIDAFAREVYERFSDPALDPSLAAGEHGLFSDAQAGLTVELGLANRLAVADTYDPDKGGDLWRIRTGRNATGPGEVGDSTLLLAMTKAQSENRNPASPALTSSPASMLGLASELASQASSFRIRTEAAQVQDLTHSESLKTALLSEGVDTDTEMQALLTLERAYAANAKVLQTASDMLAEILRLT